MAGKRRDAGGRAFFARIALLLTLAAAAARPGPADAAAFSFDAVQNYPATGLMFPNLFRAAGEPVPLPRAHPYLPVNTGDTLTREDRFDPFDLWYADQCCGRWRDPAGRTLILGRMTRSYPSLTDRHVSLERFSLEMARAGSAPNPRDRDALNRWVATFAGTAVYPPEKRDINKFALEAVLAYRCDEPGLLVYAFRPRRVGSASAHDWFCAALRTADGDVADEARAIFEEEFLARIKLPPRSSRKKGVRAEELELDEKTAPAEPQRHPVCAIARKGIENYGNWWTAETDGYLILSDVYSATGKALIRDLQKQLPLLKKTAARLLPPLAPLENEVSLIRLFQRREDYVRYLGGDMAWSGGAWDPSRRELVLYLKGGNEEMLPTIRHEAFHQYLSYAYAMIPAAAWLNEGHACLFEPAWINAKGRMLFAENEDRARFLVDNLDTAVSLLPQVLSMSYEEFYAGTQGEKLLKYAMAWGLAYFLQKGVPTVVVPETFPSILPAYAAALAKTRDGQEATARAFAGIEMPVFQEAFRNFWLSDRSRALKHDPAAPR